MLIAQLDFAAGISDSVHIRVAGIAVDSTVVERPKEIDSWKRAVRELHEKTVRVLVFKDSSEHFLNALGEKMQHTQIPNVCGRVASLFVLGAVDKTSGEATHMFTYHPEEDSSRGGRWLER